MKTRRQKLLSIKNRRNGLRVHEISTIDKVWAVYSGKDMHGRRYG